MLKNTITGSLLAKLMPTMSKYFLENASQEDVNRAEQEAAVLHQQMQGNSTAEATAIAEAVPPAAPTAATPATPVSPAAAPTAADLTAVTTRATTAEAQVTALTNQLTAMTTERDRYKAWHDKYANAATALPAADASNRGSQSGEQTTLSAASSAALDQFRRSRRPV